MEMVKDSHNKIVLNPLYDDKDIFKILEEAYLSQQCEIDLYFPREKFELIELNFDKIISIHGYRNSVGFNYKFS